MASRIPSFRWHLAAPRKTRRPARSATISISRPSNHRASTSHSFFPACRAHSDGAICSPSAGDTFETNFISNGGQRNIFRQSWQKRADLSIVKVMPIDERFSVRYSFDIYNLTNHPSFDIPIDNIDQNLAFSPFPVATAPYGTSTTPALASGCNSANPSNGFYFCPTGLGQVVKTIGSSRQIQMSLSVLF